MIVTTRSDEFDGSGDGELGLVMTIVSARCVMTRNWKPHNMSTDAEVHTVPRGSVHGSIFMTRHGKCFHLSRSDNEHLLLTDRARSAESVSTTSHHGTSSTLTSSSTSPFCTRKERTIHVIRNLISATILMTLPRTLLNVRSLLFQAACSYFP